MELRWANIRLQELDTSKIPKTCLDPMTQVDKCNQYLDYIKSTYTEFEFIRSNLGKISKAIENLGNYYEINSDSHVAIEITIHDQKKGWAILQLASTVKDNDGEKVSGYKGFKKMVKILPELRKEISTNLDEMKQYKVKAKKFYDNTICDYAFQGIPDGVERLNGRDLHHVYSLDFHKAFPGALAEIRPEFKDRLEEWAKTDLNFKFLANPAIGMMCSKSLSMICGVPMGLSKLRYEILDHHARKMNEMVRLLEEKGCKILNLRTDSIKFFCGDPKVLTGLPYEGKNIGEWSFEFKDCRYRQFSTGKYQYIDNNGKHIVKMNGLTRLDKVKPRSNWLWDDLLYCGEPLTWKFDEENMKIIGGSNNEQTSSQEESESEGANAGRFNFEF